MKSSSAVATVLALMCALVLSSNYAAAQSCRDKCQSAHTYRLGSCEREQAMVNHCRNRLKEALNPGASIGPCSQSLLDFNHGRCVQAAEVMQKQCYRRCG